ncbi:MAG TPA: L-histidine N(alpha)-methyltransferase [Xanthobacteraceae bacterium]|jgi:dimethylhistidine N-methyltransferase|nr:L-histidine N(alpha)-methyltransferase [Xanthobacteraceae bacterium]
MSIVVRRPRALAIDDPGRTFLDDVLAGLLAEPKRLPPKYFYDRIGSELFQRITTLPEYYLTRTEIGILEARAGEIAKLIPANAAVVEFGAGSSAKTRILLRAAPQISAYVPVDISGAFLAAETAQLQQEMPDLRVLPIAADFMAPFALPAELGGRPRIGFFPGSTIGNLEPHEANALLRQAAAILGRGALFVVGVDLVKDPDILTAAYNDRDGVTAAFNLNLLMRINHELGGEFNPAAFRHRACYNSEQRRIEMHLVSLARQRVRACGKSFDFRRGETIHTENSYKYTVESFRSRALGAGWTSAATFVDAQNYFSVHVLRAKDAAA